MRIAIINWSRRRAGGVESYLSSLIPELIESGHQAAFWHEVDYPVNREPISLPGDLPAWCVARAGTAAALAALRAWKPDLLYTHGLLDPALEAATLDIAPAVFFVHSYYGTCISGAKTFKHPVVKPCGREFGPGCLLHFYPHRCGGWSPLTMLKEYRRQSLRLDLLFKYQALITPSGHMRDEYIKHGIAPERIHDLLYYVRGQGQPRAEAYGPAPEDLPEAASASQTASGPETIKKTWRLLFLGRMELLKGGAMMLDALPKVSELLGHRLHVTFAGDGCERRKWERQARRVEAQYPAIEIEFTGWVKGRQLNSILSATDLLVLPSLWPEPFGLVGPEAGLRGVPVVAFAVGGISDWLYEGINGHLAPGNPPTAGSLAQAIIKCLANEHHHERLRRGGMEMAHRFDMKNHLSALMKVFERVGR